MNVERRSEEPQELRLNLPAAHSAGRMARQMLRRFAAREGVPKGELETLEFVAGELLDNAVDHGGGERAMHETDLRQDVRMTLMLRVSKGRWSLQVGDQGGGKPDEVRGYLSTEGLPDLEDERGRGFFLIAQMVDEIVVAKTEDGRGLLFEITKGYDEADRG